MSGLDCNTAKGRAYISAQLECLNLLSVAWNCQVVMTNTACEADIDALAIKEGVISAALEIKSREMSLAELENFGSYLITFDKILKLRNVGYALHIPSFVIVYLLKDGKIVYWKISDEHGNLLPRIKGQISKTQATCNGGLTNRYNAYLSLEDMKKL